MRRNLLVADTESWAVEVVSAAARAAGLEVVTARTGADAVDRYLEYGPCFVILDGMLPMMDGVQVARTLRRTLAGSVTPIVLTQALPPADPDAACRDLGVTAILPKPFGAADVARVLSPFLPRVDTPTCALDEPDGDVFSLADTSLALLLVERRRQRSSGRLIVHQAGVVKELALRGGMIVGVESNAEADGWSQWLARDPGLDPVRRRTAGRLAEEAPFLGLDEIIEMGIVDSAGKEAARARRAVSIGIDALTWTSGTGCWRDQQVATSEVHLDGYRLALWALRRRPAAEALERWVPAAGARLRRPSEAPEVDLSALEQQVASLADEACRVEEAFALGRLVQVDVRSAIATMIAAQVLIAEEGDDIDLAEQPARLPEVISQDIATQGELAATPPARLLATLWARRATGVLELSDESRSRALHLADGQIVFAHSNRTEHRLGQILLTQGKICEQEHAQALAAQGGGRRIGALLIAHGALTLRELYDGLVEQIRAIVADVVAMTGGSYSFLAGNAGVEDRIGAGTTPDLILEGFRRMRLDPEHLARLPADQALLVPLWDATDLARLGLTATEKAIVDGLGDGATTAEVMRLEVDREDAMRALHALLALGIVQPVSGDMTVVGDAEVLARALREVVRDDDDLPADLADAYRELKADYDAVVRENQRLRRSLREAEAHAEPVGAR